MNVVTKEVFKLECKRVISFERGDSCGFLQRRLKVVMVQETKSAWHPTCLPFGIKELLTRKALQWMQLVWWVGWRYGMLRNLRFYHQCGNFAVTVEFKCNTLAENFTCINVYGLTDYEKRIYVDWAENFLKYKQKMFCSKETLELYWDGLCSCVSEPTTIRVKSLSSISI